MTVRLLWLLPIGSAIALIVGNGPISVFAFGVFIKPLEAEFGWSRASISTGLSLCGLFSPLFLPLGGGRVGAVGGRRPPGSARGFVSVHIAALDCPSVLCSCIALSGLG